MLQFADLHSNIFKLILSFLLNQPLIVSYLHSNIFKLILVYFVSLYILVLYLHSNIFKLIHQENKCFIIECEFTF